jgi:hypothetical protein
MSDHVRIFYAHARGMQDKDIDARAEKLREIAGSAFPGKQLTVTTGRDDYRTRAKAEGGWAGWTYSVGGGTDHEGLPRFHAVVSDAEHVGKATADIMRYAQSSGRKVIFWDGADLFAPVTGVVDSSKDNWKAGWSLTLG